VRMRARCGCTAVHGCSRPRMRSLKVPQVRDRIDHGPPFALLFNQPIQKSVHFPHSSSVILSMFVVDDRNGACPRMSGEPRSDDSQFRSVSGEQFREHADILQIAPAMLMLKKTT